MTLQYLEQPLRGDVTSPKNDIYTPTSDQEYALGTRYRKPDGRVFHYAQAGAVALVAGDVIQSQATGAVGTEQQDMTIATASAAGDNFGYATIKTDTTTTKDYFKDGWYIVSDGTAAQGGGQIYQIKSHPAAGAATCKFTFYDNIKVLISTSAKAGVIRNPYKAVIQLPATTLTGFVLGVAPVAVTISYYFWLQTWGMANVLCKGAIDPGEDVALELTTAGSCDAQKAGASSFVAPRIGIGGHTIATTDWGFVYLQIAP